MATAEALLAAKSDELEGVDAILFPEMGLIGYEFASREEIMPFTEPAEEHGIASPYGGCRCGETVQWARKLSRHFSCLVQVGFARVADDGKLFNSVAVVKGDTVSVYDKHHLYYSDARWAEAGSSFRTVDLDLGKRKTRVGLGICMDINPYRFEAPWASFELATFNLERNSDLLFGSMAWCGTKDTIRDELAECGVAASPESSGSWSTASGGGEEDSSAEDDTAKASKSSAQTEDEISQPIPRDPWTEKKVFPKLDPEAEPDHGPWPPNGVTDPSMSTVSYWANRLAPLIFASEGRKGKPFGVVICNRTGTERGTTFLGTSCALWIARGKIAIKACLGRGKQDVLIAELPL
ncbi:carbon-nitrogen hydrolase [Hyaloraphidium curvatum]|nr:carbon-nitrogen hydrolase [Hyaloraphidium curvatum]